MIVAELNGTHGVVQLYKRRWFFLLVICLLFTAFSFSALAVSQINNVFVDYFQVPYAVVDWGTIGNFPGLLLSLAVVAWLTHNKHMKFRALSIAEAVFLVASFACRMIAFVSPSLFVLVIIGQLLSGACDALSFPLCLSLALAWFPENEIGTAIGLFMFSGSIGLVLGTLLPSHLVVQPTVNTTMNNETWRTADRDACLFMWGIPLLISMAGLAVLVGLATDTPPSPPTLVQRKSQSEDESNLTFGDFMVSCKNLLKNKNYMIAASSGAVLYHVNVCEYTMMTQLMTKILRNTESHLNPDVVSSYAASLLASGGLIGAIVSGRVLDKFKRYKLQLSASAFLAVICCSCITIAYHFDSYQAIYALHPIFGFSTRSFVVVLLEILTQITYPIDAAFVGTVFNGMSALATVIITEVARITFNSVGGFSMLIFQTGCAGFGMFLGLAIQSESRRLDAERQLHDDRKQEDTNESTCLLKDE